MLKLSRESRESLKVDYGRQEMVEAQPAAVLSAPQRTVASMRAGIEGCS